MLSESNPITSSISAKIKTFYATQICSQLTLLTSEISSGLPQVMRKHYTAAYTIEKALKTIVLAIV